eukprot:2573626-Lingulodinium_polyedra.AAC.1
MKRCAHGACGAHFAALKRRTARSNTSPCSVSKNAPQRCSQTRGAPLQGGEMRHARTHHART